jgi:hypothetical protein
MPMRSGFVALIDPFLSSQRIRMQSIWAARHESRAAGRCGEVTGRQMCDRRFEVHRIACRLEENVTRVTDKEQRMHAALYHPDTTHSSEAVREGIA